VVVDLDRIRVEIDPMAEWQQMYAEAGRLMRDHFWIADMGGVDWDAVLERYRPVLARLGTRDDLSELLWEVQGELGASHAYETPPERAMEKSRRLGLLGADLAADPDGVWRVSRVVPGESSAPAARSPLSAPGVGVQTGDAIVAVGGRPVDPVTGPTALLVGAAELPVELTIAPADATDRRHVVVVPLATEMPLRYQDWVAGRRAAVHAASGGRAGYLHIPDMVANGWAQLHRDIRVELGRDCVVVDVRDNNGGHVSSLVLEKLARTVQGWATVRHMRPIAYPEDAPRGPLVAITNEQAGSDGDIVTAMIRQLGLGPVLGTRTWGGVIGIDGRYSLVDGTQVTQPRYSFWFADAGWGVENYGVEPDIEVLFPPQAWAAGTDPQLEAAVELVLERLAATPAATPPDTSGRPDRAAPVLPPRA
ncbi:MAG: PDZ domain-containing protein, partial [Geodermatophilaceae bacterium]|nr:PDZ domain-containing protein [Geodermatophilaceae bacterium]